MVREVLPARMNRNTEVCAVIMACIIGACLPLLAGCRVVSDAGGHVAEWIACPTDLIDCGAVMMCESVADNPLGHIEICVDIDDHPEDLDAVEALYGLCEPTPRHEGLCLVHCDAGDGPGCNAFSGCFCPERP